MECESDGFHYLFASMAYKQTKMLVVFLRCSRYIRIKNQNIERLNIVCYLKYGAGRSVCTLMAFGCPLPLSPFWLCAAIPLVWYNA